MPPASVPGASSPVPGRLLAQGCGSGRPTPSGIDQSTISLSVYETGTSARGNESVYAGARKGTTLPPNRGHTLGSPRGTSPGGRPNALRDKRRELQGSGKL